MQSPIKVAITGAAGQIGYALLFRIAAGEVFGPNTPIVLHLLELPASLPALEGVAMEIADCAFPLLRKVVCTDDLKTALSGVHWALLVGAAPRKAGMERADLLKINGSIFAAQGKALNEVADDAVRALVVGNPCNTNALIAMHHAPDIPQDRFFAMTLLDQYRAVSQLAQKARVPVTDVSRLAVWGNHSATQYPDFYQARIQAKPLMEVIHDKSWLQHDFIRAVQQRGAAVITARGASSAASAANAALGTVYHLTHDTPAEDWFSVARCSQGEYGIEKGLIFSYPCRMEHGVLKVVPDLSHNAFGQAKLQETQSELQEEREVVKSLGLIS